MPAAKKIHNVQDSLLKLIGGEAKLTAISSLNFDPNNPNHHPDKNIEVIKSSLEQFGQDQVIVVMKQGMIVRKGNGRLQAAKELGWTHIAAIVIDESEIESIARGLADNRSSELSQWNDEILANVMSQLVDEEYDPTSIGWDEDELAAMLSETSDAPDCSEGEAEGDIELPDPVEGGNKGDFVIFRFGDFKGYVSRNIYEKFREIYESKRSESGEVQIDDVIHHWLKIDKAEQK